MRSLLQPVCPPPMMERFLADKNCDFSLELPMAGRTQRFRASYFFSAQEMGACFRIIPNDIPDFQWAGFPAEVGDKLAHYRNGLVLVSGVAGSGKTTTLAMIINLLNQEGGSRIITVEEPVEYLFPKSPDSVVTQRHSQMD